MEEQLETSRLRVRDAAVTLGEKGASVWASFLAIGYKPRVIELNKGTVISGAGIDGVFFRVEADTVRSGCNSV